MKRKFVFCCVLLIGSHFIASGHGQQVQPAEGYQPSAAYRWLDILLEAAAQDVERIGARPTILSRQMAIPLTAAYDAWAAFDDSAVSKEFGDRLRRPESERTTENKETAIAYAMYRTMLDLLPYQAEFITAQMRKMGYDPDATEVDMESPAGLGNYIAQEILRARHHDGANQLGDEIGSNGQPYSDYTMYRPVNPVDRVIDPDRWQPLPFESADGKVFYPGFLTAQWYRVQPFALQSASQFRAPPPPKYGSEQLEREIRECIDMNANLTVEQKAIVEFMRDGPRSTGQSGHWLRFAQALSRRDNYGLDQDIKLYFTISNVAMDAFISAWETKRFYDTSRPWTLIRYRYAQDQIHGWAGPGQGVKLIMGTQWHPYSPKSFVTPPFPGYVSGHSTVSSACATALKLFTGSDRCEFVESRHAGELTEAEFTCAQMQKSDLAATPESLDCNVMLKLPTFSGAAEMAGISRVLGGYHIQADNIAGLNMGRQVAEYSWPIYQAYFAGDSLPVSISEKETASPRPSR